MNFNFDVDLLTGRGTLIPVFVFRKYGNFNKKLFFHYGADFEFFYRIKKAGIKIGVSYNIVTKIEKEKTKIRNDVKNKSFFHKVYKYIFLKSNKTNIITQLLLTYKLSSKKRRLKNTLITLSGFFVRSFFKRKS